MGTGTRRMFIRTWLAVLSKMREGMTEFTAEGVMKLIEGVAIELEAADKCASTSDGE